MPADVPPSSPRSRSQLLWLLAWAAVGAGVALAVSAIGVFAVPLAVAGAVLLVVRHHAGRAAFGVLVGMESLFLSVAYVQRKGPGTGRAVRTRAQHGE